MTVCPECAFCLEVNTEVPLIILSYICSLLSLLPAPPVFLLAMFFLLLAAILRSAWLVVSDVLVLELLVQVPFVAGGPAQHGRHPSLHGLLHDCPYPALIHAIMTLWDQGFMMRLFLHAHNAAVCTLLITQQIPDGRITCPVTSMPPLVPLLLRSTASPPWVA